MITVICKLTAVLFGTISSMCSVSTEVKAPKFPIMEKTVMETPKPPVPPNPSLS